MFPLGLKHSTQYVKSRLALVGDSAHRIHPMAGQGVNLGFGDIKCLISVLEDAIIDGEDFGKMFCSVKYDLFIISIVCWFLTVSYADHLVLLYL